MHSRWADDLSGLRDFYKGQLKGNILPFWLKRCLDERNGGYFNCFDNRGLGLVSRDKYTWSQGRFLWLFSTLATDEACGFTSEEQKLFLAYARSGYDFLKSHCFLPSGHCAFVMDEEGRPKGEVLDASIYADCFAAIGFAAYGLAAKDGQAKALAGKTYAGIRQRVTSGIFNSQPYPLPQGFMAHGIPMIMSNVAMQMSLIDKAYLSDLEAFTDTVQQNFVDDSFTVRETIDSSKGICDDYLLFTHANPGHSLEDAWFMLDASQALGREDIQDKAIRIARRALETGWDEEHGGILHFCDRNGGEPRGLSLGTSTETLVSQGWGDKLWWVHSEALYTTLRCYLIGHDEQFMKAHERIKEYTFSHFPNPDKAIGEWIQILDREGRPMDKVVALPVKDPFHIARDFLLICRLLG